MPEMDGHETLRQIRQYEKENDILLGHGIKILMTTALNDSKNVFSSFKDGCEGYMLKPVSRDGLNKALAKSNLLQTN